jgi:hypothetical protein
MAYPTGGVASMCGVDVTEGASGGVLVEQSVPARLNAPIAIKFPANVFVAVD